MNTTEGVARAIFIAIMRSHSKVAKTDEPDRCGRCGGRWPCEVAQLLAIIDATDAQLEEMKRILEERKEYLK